MDAENNRNAKNLSDDEMPKSGKSEFSGIVEDKDRKKARKYAKPKNIVIKDEDDLMRHLELMHDRCITRNLQAAGLGGLDPDQESLVYGELDPNAKMISGETMLVALLYKVKDQEKQVRYISILLNEGADPNHIDNDGKTALMHTCTLGLEKSSKTLLHYATTDLALKDRNGNTALMLAASGGHEKIVKAYCKTLRKWEKRLERKRVKSNEDGEATSNSVGSHQPSQYYPNAYLGDVDHVFAENVLEIRNDHGESAYDLACRHDHAECVRILDAEKAHQMKALQRKLIALNHDKRRSSNSAVVSMQAAKDSLTRRYTRTFGSFDDLFDRNREDKSDDELMSEKLTNFSHRLSIANNAPSAAAQSHPNLAGDYLNMNQQLEPTSLLKSNINAESQQKLNNSGGGAVSTSSRQSAAGPDFEKLAFWEDFFPHTRLKNHTLSSDIEQKPTKSVAAADGSYNSGMRKSNTESSLSAYQQLQQQQQQQQVGTSPAKRTLAQRLVGLLKRRSKHHLPVSTEDQAAPNGNEKDLNVKLKKGISQPNLMRKMSKDSATIASVASGVATPHKRFINIVDKRRKSTDLNIAKSLKSIYTQQQAAFVPVQTEQKFSNTNLLDAPGAEHHTRAADNNAHSSLSVRSSLPPLNMRSVPNRLPLAPFIDQALIDNSAVPDRRRKSFDFFLQTKSSK